MERRGWLIVVAVGGAAIFGLSFVNAWIDFDRELRGEGYRHVRIGLSAWRSVAFPTLAGGVLAALGAATLAVASLRGAPSGVARLVPVAAFVSLALTATSVVPLRWDGFTTSIDLRPGWLTPVGLIVAAGVAGAAVRATNATGRFVVVVGVLSILVAAGGIGLRGLVLDASGGDDETWSDGVYLRQATPAGAGQTLTIADGTFRIGDRWSGAWEGSGDWTFVLADDPACPAARGAYHAHRTGDSGQDLRFVMVVDTCAGGARAADLEAGVWKRGP